MMRVYRYSFKNGEFPTLVIFESTTDDTAKEHAAHIKRKFEKHGSCVTEGKLERGKFVPEETISLADKSPTLRPSQNKRIP